MPETCYILVTFAFQCILPAATGLQQAAPGADPPVVRCPAAVRPAVRSVRRNALAKDQDPTEKAQQVFYESVDAVKVSRYSPPAFD